MFRSLAMATHLLPLDIILLKSIVNEEKSLIICSSDETAVLPLRIIFNIL